MPDWSYRTVFRPVFFKLPAKFVRDFCLGFMGTLSRLPLGPHVISFLGHMKPDRCLKSRHAGIDFPTRVGLGVGIDSNGLAYPALSRFGFGFLEVGPVSLEPRSANAAIERLVEGEAIRYEDASANLGIDRLEPRIAEASRQGIPVIVRITANENCSAEQASEQCRQIIARLGDHADAFSLLTIDDAASNHWSEQEWRSHLDDMAEAAREFDARLLLCLPPDLTSDEVEQFVAPALAAGFDGLLVEGGIREFDRGRITGQAARDATIKMFKGLRDRATDRLIIAGGGVHDPEHALAVLEAGANLVQVDTGLVFSGPGLPKRVNEATRFAIQQSQDRPDENEPVHAAGQTWFWTLLMGIGMFCGGILALVIAATLVVLPYDESFVGMTREQLIDINPRLIKFMSHDRVTLAGTMISVGVLYYTLSMFGIRRGLHWAKIAVLTSAFAGFASFFLFLGFGYFDPFHAFVTAVLFQFLLLAMHSQLPKRIDVVGPDLREDWSWRMSQWGQLLYIIHGAVLITAGSVISFVGITKVFVPEDLMFMQTTAEQIKAANDRLIPLIAHDRATFGGMLISVGVAVLLPSLWGFQTGAKWLWWALLLGGLAGYVPTIVIHVAVGYTHLGHLAPALGGLVILLIGAVLSYAHLCDARENVDKHWQLHIDSVRKWI